MNYTLLPSTVQAMRNLHAPTAVRRALALTLSLTALAACDRSGSTEPGSVVRRSGPTLDRGRTVANDDAPVFFLNLDPDGAKVRIVKAAELSEEARRLRERNANDPEWQTHLQRFREVVARGPAPLALVDGRLPNGAVARVLLDPRAEHPRLVVASAATVTDEILTRAQQVLRSYELRGPAEPTRVELTIYQDGLVRVERNGSVREIRPDVRILGREGTRYTDAIKLRAAQLSPVELKGVGPARIVETRGRRGAQP